MTAIRTSTGTNPTVAPAAAFAVVACSAESPVLPPVPMPTRCATPGVVR